MSRNSEYKFVNTDADQLVNLLVTGYERIVGISVRPASPEKLFIQWVANILLIERVRMNYVGNQNLPSRAEGNNLDAIAELFFGLKRPTAQAATSTVRFTISAVQSTAILIPAGTRVTDVSSTLFWATLEDAYIAIGDTSVDLKVQCLTLGEVGNGYVAGQLNTIVDLFPYASSCSNITDSAGGADEATDDEYYELLVASMDSASTAGARGTYTFFAKNVSTDIADVVANTPSAGTVYIYVLMNDGTLAPQEIKTAVFNACNPDNVRPLTDHVFVMDASAVTYNINFTYYVPSDTTKSLVQIAADVEDAVDKYVAWQNAKFGRDINPDKLREFLFETGIKRVALTSPVFTPLKNGNDNTAPQVASLGTKTIIAGGYEDE